jgi:hypothetical protein
MNKLVKLFVFLPVFLALLGCGAEFLIGPAITGVIYWVNGEAHKYYQESPEVVYRSAKHALTELGLPISKDNVNDNSFRIVAGEKDRFSISIYPADKGLTRFDLRINFMGDKDYAELIYKKTDEKLNFLEFDPDGDPTRKRRR